MAYSPRTQASAGNFVGISRYLNANRNHANQIGSRLANDLESQASELQGEIQEEAADGWIEDEKLSGLHRRAADTSARLGLTAYKPGVSALLGENRNLSSGQSIFDSNMIGTDRFSDLRNRFSGISSMLSGVQHGNPPTAPQDQPEATKAQPRPTMPERTAAQDRIERAKGPKKRPPFSRL